MTKRSTLLRGSDGLPLSVAGMAAVCAIPVTLGVCVWLAWPLKSMLGPRAVDASTKPVTGPASTSFADAQARRLDLVRGRSLFYIPGPPSEEKDTGPKATVYAGPQLVAMINDTAWFADGTTLEIGAAPVKGLKVLSLNAPWSAHVEWQGGEFDVELFKRTDIESLKGSSLPPLPVAIRPASQPAQAQGTLGGTWDKGGGPGAVPGAAPDRPAPGTPEPPAPEPRQEEPPPPPTQTPPQQSPSTPPSGQPANEPTPPPESSSRASLTRDLSHRKDA